MGSLVAACEQLSVAFLLLSYGRLGSERLGFIAREETLWPISDLSLWLMRFYTSIGLRLMAPCSLVHVYPVLLRLVYLWKSVYVRSCAVDFLSQRHDILKSSSLVPSLLPCLTTPKPYSADLPSLTTFKGAFGSPEFSGMPTPSTHPISRKP